MHYYQLKYDTAYPGIAYDYANGYFYRLKAGAEIDKRLVSDYLGYITYLCHTTRRKVKKKAEILAYEIMQGKPLSKYKKLYFKDLNPDNLKYWNIGCVSQKQYNTIKDAVYNINGGIKIVSHPTDAYVYFVYYKTKNRIKKKICHDIVSALKVKRIILITSNKVLSKYIVSN